MWRLRSLVYPLMASATCRILTSTLVDDARLNHHPKAVFLSAAVQTLRGHLSRSTQIFQAYFLASFVDKDYTKVLDSIAKVDKSLRSKSIRPRLNLSTSRFRPIMCQFRRNPPPYGSRGGNCPFPYQRPARGRPSS